MTRPLTALTALIALLVLAACGSPAALQSNQPLMLAPRSVAAAPAAPTQPAARPSPQPQPATDQRTVAQLAATPLAQSGAHPYEGDRQNSVTIKAGDIVSIRNPDFSRAYTFKIVSIEPGHITVATDEPNVTIRDNGSEFPYFLHATESMATGYELPIGWARFTPIEKIPVVQTYSMQPGGTVVRGQDDG